MKLLYPPLSIYGLYQNPAVPWTVKCTPPLYQIVILTVPIYRLYQNPAVPWTVNWTPPLYQLVTLTVPIYRLYQNPAVPWTVNCTPPLYPPVILTVPIYRLYQNPAVPWAVNCIPPLYQLVTLTVPIYRLYQNPAVPWTVNCIPPLYQLVTLTAFIHQHLITHILSRYFFHTSFSKKKISYMLSMYINKQRLTIALFLEGMCTTHFKPQISLFCCIMYFFLVLIIFVTFRDVDLWSEKLSWTIWIF